MAHFKINYLIFGMDCLFLNSKRFRQDLSFHTYGFNLFSLFSSFK